MDSNYLGIIDFSEEGFTISSEFLDLGQGVFPFMPDDFDPENTEIIEQHSGVLPQTRFDDVTESIRETRFQQSSTEAVLEARECPLYFPAIFIILTVTGVIASFLAYADTIIQRKKVRHYHNFLHIFVSSLLILLPVPFNVVSRFTGQWRFGDAWFKVLAVVTSAAQTTCALQLAYLTQIRCREVIWVKETVASAWKKTVCYVIWLIAFASAWPCGVHKKILCDVIKAEPISQKRSFGATLYIKVNTAVGFIFPALIVTGCFIVTLTFKYEKENEKNKKVRFRTIRGVKEVAVLCLVFFLCWLPYRAWRIVTLELSTIPGCGVPPDVFLLVGIAVSSLMPILHYALTVNQVESEKDLDISVTCEDPIPLR